MSDDGRTFAAAAVTPRQWGEVAAARLLPVHVRPSAAPDPGGFRAEVTGQVVDRRLALAGVSTGPCRSSRRRGDADTGPDLVFLVLQRAGTLRVSQAGRTARVVPGEAVLFRSRGELELASEDATCCLTLQVPVATSGLHPASVQAALARTVPASGPALHLLSSTLEALVTAGPRLPPTASARAASAVLDLLDALLGSLPGPPAAQGTPWAEAVQRFLLDHLDRPELSVEVVARRFGVSPRHVTRVFADAGAPPPATFLREERLRRAARLLADHPELPLAAVAARCGFADPSTFTRAFRRRYGRAPGAWRRARPAPALPGTP